MSSDDPITPAVPASGAAVFVDSSGQRATRIRRAAAFLVLLCLAYGVALLIAALTGVPIQGAIVPYPALGSSTHSTHSNKTPQHTPTQPSAGSTSSTTFAPAGTTPSGTLHNATATKSAHGNHTSKPTAAVTPSAAATSPVATPTKIRGKSSTAPGSTNRPTTRPSSTATTHGRSGKV